VLRKGLRKRRRKAAQTERGCEEGGKVFGDRLRCVTGKLEDAALRRLRGARRSVG